ncbi:protein SRC2-like [Chenopodium quinoa]|uniref:protein SRC2-like n=1 Tax=Chenopodium quinoa TaxID=63459 RepID=UPI000B78FE5F|nr:protein SRC2-like [Chenopodium quinoa]
MASRYEVEVTVLSAKDIKNVNWRYGPTKPYAIMWFDSDRKVTTRTDDEGDTNPRWDQTLKVPLNGPIDDATLTIEVVHFADVDEDTKPHIGTAKLDLRDVLDDVGIGNSVKRKLKLKRSSGRPQGKLELEIIVRERYQSYNSYPPPHHGASMTTSRDVDYGAPQYNGESPAYGQPAAAGYPSAGYGQQGYGGYDQGQYGQQPVEEKKKSSFGGMGTGIAIGAAAGILGGLALAEGYDQFTDHLAEEAAEKVEENQDDNDNDDDNDDDE